MENNNKFAASFDNPNAAEKQKFYFEAEDMDKLNSTILNEMNRNWLDVVNLTYFKKDKEGQWVEDKKTEFYNIFQFPKFVFLKMGQQHTDGFSWFGLCHRCMEMKHKLLFNIANRNLVNFSDNILQDPKFVVYKFKYNLKDGSHIPLMAFLWVGKDVDEERKAYVKREVLREGAKWFCEHLMTTNII